MPRYVTGTVVAAAIAFCMRGPHCSAQPSVNLPGPGCFIDGYGGRIPEFGWWISCPRCRYKLEHGESNEVVLSNIGSNEALLIAAESGLDVLYSSNIPSESDSSTEVLWYGYNLKAQADPFTEDEKFDNSSIECYREEQDGDGLWLRWDPKRDHYIFLPTTVRQDELIKKITDNMSGCRAYLISAKTDEQLWALLDGMAKDQQPNVLLEGVKAAILASIVLLPELSTLAPMLARAIEKCGTLCATANTFIQDAVKDPEQLKGVLAGLSQQSVDLASQQANNAEKEVAFATDASKFFLQQWEDQIQARTDAIPSMTNQWLYALQEIYSTESASGSNCTVEGAAKVMHTFMDNARYINDFSSSAKYNVWGKFVGQFEGICKVDGDWYYAKFEYSYTSARDCKESVKTQHAKVDAQYLEMAMNAAPATQNPCQDDSFVCQSTNNGTSDRRRNRRLLAV